ncbi:MAG TPA: thioredoxin domain-containing protein [Blastocatellia bacterium]|nr:thioredoxin domain-containing protein [Blastocatellia bacterium]
MRSLLKTSSLLFLFAACCFALARAQSPAPGKAGSSGGNSPKAGATSAKAENKADDCGCETKPQPNVVAVVNGVQVKIDEIDEPIKSRVSTLREQVVEARKRELDLQINGKLLDAEAAKRGISATDVLQQEVRAKVKGATDAEAQAFYDQNKSRIDGAFADVKNDILAYLRDQREREEAKKLSDRLRSGAEVKVLVEKVTPPEQETDRARLFATVNGARISSGDIEESLAPLIFSVEEQVFELRKKQLDLKINDILLEQEAQKRKITPTALLEAEVTSKVKKPTEEDARSFYEQNKDRIVGAYFQVHTQIMAYLQTIEQQNAEGAFAEQLRKAGSVQVFLSEPDPPALKISTDDQPWKGGAAAPVTIVEFTDFECPSCAGTQPVLEQIVKEYGDRVKLVTRDFPLNQHGFAFKAAEAAEAAREQGKYWEYIAILFNNQKALDVEKLREYARTLGLDLAKFDAALSSGKYTAKVQRDLDDGNRLGVDSTPTVFVNGRRMKERTIESLKAAVEAALKSPPKKAN